jgi:mono/diheme cytochrome c family protein
MRRARYLLAGGLVTFSSALALSVGSASAPATTQEGRPNPDGWQLPPNAADEQNPLTVDAKVLSKGKEIFDGKCKRCHGPEGLGDGPDGDPDHMPGDLTDSSRAEKNPDGVMFYKVWNGRRKPKMPAFKSEMSKEDVWTVVSYVKTLRK